MTSSSLETNVIYHGDNLEVLRQYITDGSVDLIYLDPPFNSKATYKVLLKEATSEHSQTNLAAFEDTWRWGPESERALREIATSPVAPVPVKEFMSVLPRLVVRRTEIAAYLVMMAIRLIELKRVLKDTGSIYLHCDATASHYLKLLMDAIFGVDYFRNEIVWKRFSGHGNVYRSYGKIHDILFLYTKGARYCWHQVYRPLSQNYVDSFFRSVDPDTGRHYQLQNVLNPNKDRPNLTYEWHGQTRIWKWTREKMQQLHNAGLLVYSKNGLPRLKQYLDESKGEKLPDVWDDIRPVGQASDKSMGYQTQKPEALLERIIKTSSNEGDIILDPFCGSGTAIVVAQRLNRKWIGIDAAKPAISLLKLRLSGVTPMPLFTVIGGPKGPAGAV